jgi:predicted nucleic acid-binding protein
VQLWDGCDAAVASRLAYPEVRAALAAAARHHDLADRDLDAAEQAWDQYWAAVRPVELTAAVEQHAGRLAAEHSLRGADAVHLASALAVGHAGLAVALGPAAPYWRPVRRLERCPGAARRLAVPF